MREIRTSGSEGGGAESNQLSLPLYISPGLSEAIPGVTATLYTDAR